MEREREKGAGENTQENVEIGFLVGKVWEMVSEPFSPCLSFLLARLDVFVYHGLFRYCCKTIHRRERERETVEKREKQSPECRMGRVKAQQTRLLKRRERG